MPSMITRPILLALAALTMAVPAHASTPVDQVNANAGALAQVLQCVPYAREVTGIRIFGDAHTWWQQAAGRYARGATPRVGAIMAMRPHANSRLGHVAAVSRVINSRTVLLRHANWSSPGQIEDNVKAIDVSDRGDWSKVRVWHGPSGKLGVRHWPLFGFIYPDKAGEKREVPRSAPTDFIADVIAGRS